jgi:hypothetical protein
MEQHYNGKSLSLEYLLQEFTEIIKNNPDAAPRLIENLMNMNYDIEKKDTQFYKVLNQEQRRFLHNIHLKRLHDTEFNAVVKKVLLIAGAAAGLTYAIGDLFKNFDSTSKSFEKSPIKL